MSEQLASSDLANAIAQRAVSPGSVAGWWLGGSGFVFKSAAGTEVYIDPYLSDAASRTHGLKRGFPAPLRAEEARPRVVISTHWHEDHLDPEAIPAIAKHSPETQFVMPAESMSRAWYWGVPPNRISVLERRQSIEIDDITIHNTFARHNAGLTGWETLDPMGVVLEIDGVKIYHSGDTEYDRRLRDLKNYDFDLAIACINGVTGNMNAHEAALLLWQLDARRVMPMHHLLWAKEHDMAEATLDPNLFAQTYKNLGGTGEIILPEVGREFEVTGGSLS